jgi:Ankyrin repeat
VLATAFTAPAPATLDGKPIAGVAVSTSAFPVLVHRGAPPPLWQDSVDVGHPGRLAASSCGWKAQLKLSPGRHTGMTVHAHSTALHQAVLHDDVELLRLLIEHGARTDVRDTIHDGTPLRWAQYLKLPNATAYLESLD